MTTPAITPIQYNRDYRDYLKVKSDKAGAVRNYVGTVTVPTGTVATTIVGLIPFNKGARFHMDSFSVHVGATGAGTTTASLGVIYEDNVTFANNQTLWASASTAPQAGGFITPAGAAGLQFVAQANGWVAVTFNTATTNNTADITFNVVGDYDGLGINNQNNQN